MVRFRRFGASVICLVVAIVVFLLASLGWWPDDLADDIEPVALGLALFAAAFLFGDVA